ncbi:MAG: hypothetical protein ABW321_02940 [Polyangiales bacterium]
MTTDVGRVTWWLGSLLVSASLFVCAQACAGQSKIRHGDTLDVAQYPADIQRAYRVFSVRCSRCHTLARPLNARIHDSRHWVRYVERMRLNPASGINAKDGQTILRFLLYYMHQRDAEQGHKGDAPAQSMAETGAPEMNP